MSADRELKVHLRRFRFENGELTQQQLADRIGVTRQTIISIEKGKYKPSVELALRLARTFGVRVEDLFTLETSEENP
jgi:putative transcriptional regulator